MNEQIAATQKKKIMKEEKQLLIILLIVFIEFSGTSIAYPIFPSLFLHPSENSIIPMGWHENARSIFLGIALAAYPLGQFVGSPIFGGCSDRYGRKTILVLSLAGSAVGYLLSAVSLYYNCLWLLITSRFLTGAMEGNFAIVRAMAVDLESISKYSSLGRINSVSGIGYVMGPLLGGLLSDKSIVPWFSFAFPFYLAVFLSIIAVLFAVLYLSEQQKQKPSVNQPIWQQFKLIMRFGLLFKNNQDLKYLLIISTIFTFSVDIFYEFSPVYLTGLWSITPAGIAVYNTMLSFTLALGGAWLPNYLSRYFLAAHVIVVAMLLTGIILGLMVIFQLPLFVFLLFGAIGLCIATVDTNMTVHVSNSANHLIQGETMGSQLSLRMLGNAIICLVGGFLITSSIILPIVFSCFIALIAALAYALKFRP